MCIFCKIVSGEIPSFKVYEDEFVIAFLDLSQTTKGHTLVVPKKHVENIFDLDSDTAKHVMNALVKVVNILKDKLNVKSVNLVNNSGALAGQTIMHFHIHIIPRYEGDTFSINQPVHEADFEALKALCEEINR